MNIPFTSSEIEAIKKLAGVRNIDPELLVRAMVLDAIAPPRVTIKEVALKARVSPMTVSYALSGAAGEVSEETRRRVRAVAKTLGYRPNLGARSLRRQREAKA